ncbi:MAG: DUF4112 domain-containing protein [Planctomycetota bacterium]
MLEDRSHRPKTKPNAEPDAPLPDDPKKAAAIARARRLASVLDTQFTIPGTPIRFGLDPILGLLPVAGDTITAIMGLYPIFEARRLGVRWPVILKMLLNLGLDWLVGLIPLVDLIFDVAFKANVRNLKLLEEELR